MRFCGTLGAPQSVLTDQCNFITEMVHSAAKVDGKIDLRRKRANTMQHTMHADVRSSDRKAGNVQSMSK